MILTAKDRQPFRSLFFLLYYAAILVSVLAITACRVDESTVNDRIDYSDAVDQEPEIRAENDGVWIYAKPENAIDWDRYYIEKETSVWEHYDHFLLFQQPLIYESISSHVLVVQTLHGIVAIDGDSGATVWNMDKEIAAYYADFSNDVPEIHIVDTSGFTVSLNPFTGEILYRKFSSWDTISLPGEWPASLIPAHYHTAAYRVEPGVIRRLGVREAHEDDIAATATVENILDLSGDSIHVENLPFAVEIQLPPDYEFDLDVSSAFSVPVTGRYELYVEDFETNPVLFGIVSHEGQELGKNEDYGAITDGFLIDLDSSKMYEMWFRFPSSNTGSRTIGFNVVLLMETN